MNRVVFSLCICNSIIAACFSIRSRISVSKQYWSALAIYLAETAALQWQSDGGVSPLWAQHVDWQAPLIGIDVATRCVSVLWLLISPGIQRRSQPLPCCYHRSEMGVTMIKSSFKHSLCVVCICVSVMWRVCVFLISSSSVCVCAWVYVCGWTWVPHRPDCIAIVFTSAPLLHPLISHSTPTHLSPPASPLNLHSTQNKRQQWQLQKCWVAQLKYDLFPTSEGKIAVLHLLFLTYRSHIKETEST